MSLNPRIETSFTRLLQCQTPIIAPAMAGASGGALAASVTLAGGFGFMASGMESLEQLQTELDTAATMLETPNNAPFNIGVGFLGWKLDDQRSVAQFALDLVLRRKVRAVWLSFGNNLGKWVQYVRKNDQNSEDNIAKTLIFVVVNTAEAAVVAVNDWKVDIIVAQGIEAGGHGLATAAPTLTLVPSILNAFPIGKKPVVIAAGGLANGEHLAAMLALGASGVAYGTRFLLSEESLYTADQKLALKEATSPTATVRTMAFDEVRGTLDWPTGVDGRALMNSTVADVGKHTIEERKRRFADGTKSGDKDRILVWAGTGASLVNDLKPAKSILEDLHAAAIERLNAVKNAVIDI